MSAETVNQIVARLAQPGPLTLEEFAARLGAPLAPSVDNPSWAFYSFQLAGGPFAGGELRLNKAGTAALLSLEPRDPPGLTAAALDAAAWGPRLSLLPNPHIPPEGADTEIYGLNGVRVSAQWLHTSRRLRRLVLEWPLPDGAGPAAAPAPAAPSLN